jgi:hypothetical protein
MTEEDTISSDSEGGEEESKNDHAKMAPPAHDKQEKYQYFDLALEIFRYFVFKEESQFIQQFLPVPTIEPPSA